jgi:hypothetical protein
MPCKLCINKYLQENSIFATHIKKNIYVPFAEQKHLNYG